MNYEKPSGPMHEAIRKALEELKLHSNPYGCINLVNGAITASDSEAVYHHYLARAREESTLSLLPHHHSPGGRSHADAAASSTLPSSGTGPSTTEKVHLHNVPMRHGTLNSPPQPPVGAGSDGDHGSHQKSAKLGKGSVLQGLLMGTSASAVGGTGFTGMNPSSLIPTAAARTGGGGGSRGDKNAVSHGGPAQGAARVRPGGLVEQGDGLIDDSTFNWEDGKNITNVGSGSAAASDKKKYSFNTIQLLRLILIRCDAYSQTKQHERAVVDAKMAILLSRRRSPEAYFACGREERRLYHIEDSVKCFEAGVHILRVMKKTVLRNLRAQLLAQGYGEDGTLLVDDDGASEGNEKSRYPASEGGDHAFVASAAVGSAPNSAVASAFLYQSFSYPDSYVRLLEGNHGKDKDVTERDAGVGVGVGVDEDEEDYWAQRGYRLEDVRRMGLTRREEEQREVRRLRDFQRLKHGQLRRQKRQLQRRRRAQSGPSGTTADGGSVDVPRLHLDPMLLDSKSSSRADLHSMHEAAAAYDGLAEATESDTSDNDDADSDGEGEEDGSEAATVRESFDAKDMWQDRNDERSNRGSGSGGDGSGGGGGAYGTPRSENASRLTSDSSRGPLGDDSDGTTTAVERNSEDRDVDLDERVFSFFPEVRARSTKRLAKSSSSGDGKSGHRTTATAGGNSGNTVVVEHHQQSLFRNNNETELLFAINHYGMSPAELSGWLRMYRESRALKKMSEKKTFPASVLSTTLYLLDRKIASTRNSIALVFENALLQQLSSVVSGAAAGSPPPSPPSSSSLANVLEFVGCTAPDAQYSGEYYFPQHIRQGDVGFAVLQPKGWGGYSGCVCFALHVEGNTQSPTNTEGGGGGGLPPEPPKPSDHISIFFYFECSMISSVKYGVRCVTGIKADDLRRAFYEVNNQRGGIHGIVGAVEGERDDREKASARRTANPLSPGSGLGGGRAAAAAAGLGVPPTMSASWEWPRQETAAQRAGRLAALKAVRMPPSSSWLASQTLILRGGGGGVSKANGPQSGAAMDRKIKISVSNNINSSGGGGGSSPTTTHSGNIILFSLSERLPVKLKSVELLPALEFAGPAVLKKTSALSHRYRELTNNFPPPLFYGGAEGSGGGGGGGGGGFGAHPFTQPAPTRRNHFSFYPDYCLYGDRFSSPWVIRDREVIVFRLFFIGRIMDQEEFCVSFVDETTTTSGITTNLLANNNNHNSSNVYAQAGSGAATTTGPAGVLNASLAMSDQDATTANTPCSSVSPRPSNAKNAGANANNVLLYFSAESQSRNNAQVYYADRRCPYFNIKESWMPFSSAVYLQSAGAGGRTFATVQVTNSTVFTLALATAPRNTELDAHYAEAAAANAAAGGASGGSTDHHHSSYHTSHGIGISSGGRAGAVPSSSGIGGGGFGQVTGGSSLNNGYPGGGGGGAGAAAGGGGGGNSNSGGGNGDQENILYTVRKRIPGPTSASTASVAGSQQARQNPGGSGNVNNSNNSAVARSGPVTPSTANVSLMDSASAGPVVTAGTVVKAGSSTQGTVLTGTTTAATTAAGATAEPSNGSGAWPTTTATTTLQGRISSFSQHDTHGSTNSLTSLNTLGNTAAATPRQAHQAQQQAHVATAQRSGSSAAAANAANSNNNNSQVGPLAKADHFSVWRSTTHGKGAEIVAEIRVLCSPYPLVKGALVGEVRLLPGADALLVSTLLFILSRS